MYRPTRRRRVRVGLLRVLDWYSSSRLYSSSFFYSSIRNFLFPVTVFTALHRMQTRSSDENSACPSVKRINCDKTEEKRVQVFAPYERSFSLVFWEKERLVGATSSTWNFGSNGPRWSEIADFEPIIARSASAVTPSEKSSIYRTSNTRCPMSLRSPSYVVPKFLKGGSKRKTVDFRIKSHFAWRKSATKFPSVKIVNGKVVRHWPN